MQKLSNNKPTLQLYERELQNIANMINQCSMQVDSAYSAKETPFIKKHLANMQENISLQIRYCQWLK